MGIRWPADMAFASRILRIVGSASPFARRRSFAERFAFASMLSAWAPDAGKYETLRPQHRPSGALGLALFEGVLGRFGHRLGAAPGAWRRMMPIARR